MAARLRKLKINRVALVDSGANQEAFIEIFKRNEDSEEVEKSRDLNSLDGKISNIRNLYEKQFNMPGIPYSYVDNVYDDYVIACSNGDMFQISYSTDAKGNVTFGEPTKVQQVVTYKPVKKGNDVPDEIVENEELTTALAKIAELEGKIVELSKVEEPEPAEDEILKSLPESVRKRLEDADKDRERIAKLEDEANRTAFEKKAASDYSNIGGASEIGDVLMRINKACISVDDTKAFQALEVFLKGANARADITKEIGSSNTETSVSEGMAKVHELAKAEMEKNDSLTRSQAIAKVLEKNPKLYSEVNK